METELEFLKSKANEIHKRILELESPVIREDAAVYGASPKIIIEFDGGTSCNIPSKGFGEGYGSYQIDSLPIERVKFGMGHSCNSAEVRTILAALQKLAQYREPSDTDVVVRGDSQIALRWCKNRGGGRPSKKASQMFVQAINELLIETRKFRSIKTEWRSRTESVRIFGH